MARNTVADNPSGPTGPRTEIGKSIASRNATKDGLFAAHDFIRENETDEYAEARAALHAQVAPEGCLEETFTTESSNQRKSVDRARAQSHNILRRSLAELRHSKPAAPFGCNSVPKYTRPSRTSNS